jgi:hypothetical protein
VLFDLDSGNGGPDPLPIGPLGSVVGLGARGPPQIGDVVGVPGLLDLGRGPERKLTNVKALRRVERG